MSYKKQSNSKILVILQPEKSQFDERSNLISSLCKKYIAGIQKTQKEVNLIDLSKQNLDQLEEKSEETEHFKKQIAEAGLVSFFYQLKWGMPPSKIIDFIDLVFKQNTGSNNKKFYISDKNKTLPKSLVCTTSFESKWQYQNLYRNWNKIFFSRYFFKQTDIKMQKYFHFDKIRSLNKQQIQNLEKQLEKAGTKAII